MRARIESVARFGLVGLCVVVYACGGPTTSPTVPTVTTATSLTPPTGMDCPFLLRNPFASAPNCSLVTEGYSVALESISPAPPARLAFGQSVVSRWRYSSATGDLVFQVQPSTAGCIGYDAQISGQTASGLRVPAGSGTLERTFAISSTSVFGCGQTQIRVDNGEVYVQLIRPVLGRTDAAGVTIGTFFDQFLIAEYRFGRP
jgi:hypothetical protein